MRVLFISNDHPLTGHSGVSVYCRDLFPALQSRGVEVGAVCVQHRDWRFRAYVRAEELNGLTLFQLVNSPLDPDVSIRNPSQDVHQPALEHLVRSCVKRFQPDLVHIQTLHGYPAGMLATVKDLGIPCVITLSDFWAICPRLFLVRLRGEVCDGPDGGVNCVLHCVRPQPWRQRFYRLGSRLPEGRLRSAFFWIRGAYRQLAHRQTSMWTSMPMSLSLPEVTTGQVAPYARRTSEFLRRLGQADRLIAVSEFVESIFVRHGIEPARIRVIPSALAVGERITWQPRGAPRYPIRFGYLGRAVFVKGAHVFAEAARELPRDRARFLVFGPATSAAQDYLRTVSGDARLEFRGPYARTDLQMVLDQIDVAVVPSVVPEALGLATLEAHAAGVPVIGSRIGAIPEYVRDGETGFLFQPGDAADLREKMMRIIDEPALVASMSARTQPPISLGAHVDTLLGVYEEVVGKGRRAIWTQSLGSSQQAGGAVG